MTWRWLICFSLTGTIGCAGEITGTVRLQDSRDPAVRKNSDYSGVVISLKPEGAAAEVAGPKQRTATMLQKNKTFIPHILPIQVGTIVDFPNLDPIFHNAFSSYSGQVFDVGLYPPGKNRLVRFSRPGVVRVFCNIHPAMSAIIVVLNTPYFARTDKDGRFAISVPPGRYQLSVFHERATPQTLAALTHEVQATDERLVLPDTIVSEAGYLSTPHNNKYGKPYPPAGPDAPVYPGVRK